MARKSKPYKVFGIRPDGKTPPELMTDEECWVYMCNETIIMAEKMGGTPKTEEEVLAMGDELKKYKYLRPPYQYLLNQSVSGEC